MNVDTLKLYKSRTKEVDRYKISTLLVLIVDDSSEHLEWIMYCNLLKAFGNTARVVKSDFLEKTLFTSNVHNMLWATILYKYHENYQGKGDPAMVIIFNSDLRFD